VYIKQGRLTTVDTSLLEWRIHLRSLLSSAAAALCAAGVLAMTGPAAHAAVTGQATPTDIPACTGTVTIMYLTLNPPQVVPGQNVTAAAVAQNCTNQPQQVSAGFFARFVGPTPGIPAGCPAVDPLPPQRMTVTAGATFGWNTGYSVFAGCTATGLELTARIWDSAGALLATQTATVKITQPTRPASCSVGYRSASQWPGGFTAQITITNIGTAPVSGWTLQFAFPGDQRVTQSWNASAQQSGAAVTAGNLPYNGSVAAGASVTFGILGTWQTSNAAPTAFTLNNAACTSV
jgi:hypothetical protein